LPGLDLVAYRILQEALTNAIKHSGSASAQVSVSFGASELELGVTDSGHGPAAGRNGGEPGHGLIGMGERVALFGGELRAGPRAGGGSRSGRESRSTGSSPLPRWPRRRRVAIG
jgi:signal transduction histidine kinase